MPLSTSTLPFASSICRPPAKRSPLGRAVRPRDVYACTPSARVRTKRRDSCWAIRSGCRRPSLLIWGTLAASPARSHRISSATRPARASWPLRASKASRAWSTRQGGRGSLPASEARRAKEAKGCEEKKPACRPCCECLFLRFSPSICLHCTDFAASAVPFDCRKPIVVKTKCHKVEGRPSRTLEPDPKLVKTMLQLPIFCLNPNLSHVSYNSSGPYAGRCA